MRKKNGDKPVRVPPHPPFPSFAWVMTAQSNPPSPAYAYGYVRNAHARSGKHTRPPTRRTAPPGCHHQPRYPRCRRPPPLPARAKAAGLAAEPDEQFMDTVDYRYHDPPSRPYVPWLEGYASLRGRGAQRATGPDTTAKDSNRTLAGGASGSDDARSKKKRVRTRTTVDVVKINRLDIMLSALRRACRLSAKEEPGKP